MNVTGDRPNLTRGRAIAKNYEFSMVPAELVSIPIPVTRKRRTRAIPTRPAPIPAILVSIPTPKKRLKRLETLVIPKTSFQFRIPNSKLMPIPVIPQVIPSDTQEQT